MRALLPLVLLLSACSVGPDYAVPGFTAMPARWLGGTVSSEGTAPDTAYWHAFHDRTLDYFIFQHGNADRPLPSIHLWNILPLDRLRSVRSSLKPSGQILEVLFQVLPVEPPCLPVNPWCSTVLYRIVCRS